MRLNQRVTIVATLVALGTACRSGAPNPGAADSTPATPPPSASTTVRSDSVVMRTDKAQYRAGEKVTLTFENKSGNTYTFNPCSRALEKEAGGSWTAVPDPGRMCTMQAWLLEPRATRTGDTELDSPLAAGRYRIVVRMTVDGPGSSGSAITAVSDPITVS